MSDVQAIAAAIQEHDKFLVTTHENPDGDALGSMLAVTLALRRLGKDASIYLTARRRRLASTASSTSRDSPVCCRPT